MASKKRAIRVGRWWLPLAMFMACSEEGGEESTTVPSAAEQACSAVADWLVSCGPATPCDDALLADCAGFASIVSDGYLGSLTSCVKSGEAPSSCLASSLGALQPTQAHRDLAAQFCSECAFGVTGCEDLFFGSGEGESDERLGLILLPFGDAVAKQVQDECAVGLTCAGTFLSCAQTVIAKQGIPEQTLQCFIDQALGKGEPPRETECGGSGSGVGGGPPAGSGSVGGAGGTPITAMASTTSGMTSGGGSCSHDVCTIGAALSDGCDPCVTTVCAADEYCCSTEWDTMCVSEAVQLCGQNCDGGTSSSSASSASSTGSGMTCTDGLSEPNETEDAAKSIQGMISDCNEDGGSITGVLAGPNDKDWYKYSASDVFGCSVDPTRTFSGSDIRVCKFFSCDAGTTEVTCPSGTVPLKSPNGRSGCCGTKSFTPSVNCTGTSSDDTTVYIRVDAAGIPPANLCADYTLQYHY